MNPLLIQKRRRVISLARLAAKLGWLFVTSVYVSAALLAGWTAVTLELGIVASVTTIVLAEVTMGSGLSRGWLMLFLRRIRGIGMALNRVKGQRGLILFAACYAYTFSLIFALAVGRLKPSLGYLSLKFADWIATTIIGLIGAFVVLSLFAMTSRNRSITNH